MRKPLIRLALAACLLFAGGSLLRGMARHQDMAAGLDIEKHEVGEERLDTDFFNRPVVSEMPDTPEMKSHLQKAELLRGAVLLCFGGAAFLIALVVLPVVRRGLAWLFLPEVRQAADGTINEHHSHSEATCTST